MIRQLTKYKQIFAVGFLFHKNENPYDNVVVDSTGIYDVEALTGYERLKNLFRSNPDNAIHPALVSIYQTAIATFMVGGIYGGIKSSRKTFINFIENNEATQFRNQFDAKRQLADQMCISLFKGIVYSGPRVSFFCTSIVIAYTTLSVYQNKDSTLYYTFSGAYAGALYKIPLGFKGMFSGAVFGSLLGSTYGFLKFAMLKAANTSEQELRNFRSELKTKRDQNIAIAVHKAATKKAEEELKGLMLPQKS